jgi:HNH/ENDO VII superfamily nuclease
MSEKQHLRDLKNIGNHHCSGAGDGSGGQCLNRHEGDVKENESCSHRWQALLNARSHATWYNWPAYKSLAGGGRIKTAARKIGRKLHPDWYQQTLSPPKSFVENGVEKGEWDLGVGKNFASKCYDPYWHDAHHVIPNSILRQAILNIGKGMKRPMSVVWDVRKKLLKKQYNLNYKVNMILLPMDLPVGRALGLPIHRRRSTDRSHNSYSKNVLGELDGIFAALKKEIEDCQPDPDYDTPKDQLESYSEFLHGQIKAAGAKSLDEMKKLLFVNPQGPA